MTKPAELLANYDGAIRDLVKAMIGDQYRIEAKVNAASTRLARARQDLAEYLECLEHHGHSQYELRTHGLP